MIRFLAYRSVRVMYILSDPFTKKPVLFGIEGRAPTAIALTFIEGRAPTAIALTFIEGRAPTAIALTFIESRTFSYMCIS
ncbi:hypothetical protein BgiBS90_027477 [Biomphalaria glabrata]|nr:hypothetical protein BgiBS90_027477 [Biomphalaria glabrata]